MQQRNTRQRVRTKSTRHLRIYCSLPYNYICANINPAVRIKHSRCYSSLSWIRSIVHLEKGVWDSGVAASTKSVGVRMKFASVAFLVQVLMPKVAAGIGPMVTRGLASRKCLQCRGGSKTGSFQARTHHIALKSTSASNAPADLSTQAAKLASLPTDGTGHGCRDAPMSWGELKDMVQLLKYTTQIALPQLNLCAQSLVLVYFNSK